MPAPKKYSDERRESAVRMVNETKTDNPGLAHQRACHQTGDRAEPRRRGVLVRRRTQVS